MTRNLLDQVPSWMRKRGIAWLFWFTKEPKRLWRRYVYLNPAYVTLLVAQKLGLYGRRTDTGSEPTEDLQFG